MKITIHTVGVTPHEPLKERIEKKLNNIEQHLLTVIQTNIKRKNVHGKNPQDILECYLKTLKSLFDKKNETDKKACFIQKQLENRLEPTIIKALIATLILNSTTLHVGRAFLRFASGSLRSLSE